MIAFMVLLAAQTPTATPTPQPKKVAGGDQLICTTDTPIGSRLGGRRVCHTKAEWEQYRNELGTKLDQRSVQDNVPH